MTGEKTAYIRTRVAPNHASYVRHASKIVGWIKNACFRLVCGPSCTPLIYTCLPVACKGTHTHTHVNTSVWLPREYVSNGTYKYARIPNTRFFPGYVLLAYKVPFYHLIEAILSHSFPFFSKLERSSLLFFRGFMHTRVFSNIKCVVCASQPPRVLDSTLVINQTPLDIEASTTI